MIAGQRKAHKYIWIGMVIVLPVLIVFAVKDLDFRSERAQITSGESPISVSRTEQSVTIQVNTPLKSTASLVYEMQTNGSQGKVLGQLEGKGDYNFSISQGAKGIYIVDPIKKVELLKIEF